MQYWWDEAWEELCFDAWERLGVYYGDLPINVAFAWGRSVASIEGTHTNIRVQKIIQREKEQKQSTGRPMTGVLISNLGGNTSLIKSEGRESDYWQRLRKKHCA